MKLHHTTTVQAGPAEVWQFLQDTRAVVACLPGAELTDELGNDRYGGVLHIAIGPLKMNYNGEVDVLRRDSQARELEFAASGRDRRGGGTVRADVRVGVSNAGNGTSRLESVTDLQLTGRIAALGRGVQDVSNTMFNDFSLRLADRIATATAAPTGSGPGAERGGTSPVEQHAAGRAPASGEIRVMQLVVSVTRQRLADMLARWSEKLRP